MKNIKSHFKFAKAERSGILCILFLIFLLQGIYFYTNPTEVSVSFSDQEIVAYQKHIDSLKEVVLLEKKPKIFPFNPNFISDYKGFTLGMSTAEIDRLHKFREGNKYVNSAKEFQNVTKISDSLLNEIQSYFKFPEWVTQKKRKKYNNTSISFVRKKEEVVIEKINLNIATANQLKKVYGIGEKLSARIVKYRTKIGGFVIKAQLEDVYGLQPEVIENVWKHFYLEKPTIVKVNINTCSLEDLLKIPYINYELADEILNQRILREGFKSFDELTKIRNFPTKKIEIIELYLLIQ